MHLDMCSAPGIEAGGEDSAAIRAACAGCRCRQRGVRGAQMTFWPRGPPCAGFRVLTSFLLVRLFGHRDFSRDGPYLRPTYACVVLPYGRAAHNQSSHMWGKLNAHWFVIQSEYAIHSARQGTSLGGFSKTDNCQQPRAGDVVKTLFCRLWECSKSSRK